MRAVTDLPREQPVTDRKLDFGSLGDLFFQLDTPAHLRNVLEDRLGSS
jgi:hypothetical protein